MENYEVKVYDGIRKQEHTFTVRASNWVVALRRGAERFQKETRCGPHKAGTCTFSVKKVAKSQNIVTVVRI